MIIVEAFEVELRPAPPFVITDPAAKMALRLGMPLNQAQADALRRRVAEIEASIEREAELFLESPREVARRRLKEMSTARRFWASIQRFAPAPEPSIEPLCRLRTSQEVGIIAPDPRPAAGDRKWAQP